MAEISDAGYYYTIGPWISRRIDNESAVDYVNKIPDDLLLLEIDCLSMKDFKPPSEVFPDMIKAVAQVRNSTSEEIEALNHKNTMRLVGNDPKLSDMLKLLKGK